MNVFCGIMKLRTLDQDFVGFGRRHRFRDERKVFDLVVLNRLHRFGDIERRGHFRDHDD